MVGAQNAIKIASNFFPLRNITSETMIMDSTTRIMTKFITPIFSIKCLNINSYSINNLL